MATAVSIYNMLMQKIHNPDMVYQMVEDRMVHPEVMMDAIEEGIMFQKAVFGVEYKVMEMTKNLLHLKAAVKQYMEQMLPKRLRHPSLDDDLVLVSGKKKRV